MVLLLFGVQYVAAAADLCHDGFVVLVSALLWQH